ncbi:MAG: type II toxin-antitoxin system VapC family toxin [Candidatus Bathyarchaeia archaeon]|jgi:predicted nucleic acid-binding protein
MKHCLIDASAFMLLIKKADPKSTIKFLQDSSILDLTYYEVGNAVWKESVLTKLLTPDAAKTLQRTAETVLAKIDRISGEADSFEKIMEIAQLEKLTFYDSSYIHFAKEKGLQLITEDKELKTKAQKYVKAQTVTTAILGKSFGTDRERIKPFTETDRGEDCNEWKKGS